MEDIYFEPNYGKLYEALEQGCSTVFEFTNEWGTVHHMFIKRAIDTSLGEWFDIVTPYGYGGPVLTCLPGDELKLTESFLSSFSEYCKNQKIVSEFIRFHPVVANHKSFVNDYDVKYSRKTVGTDLERFEDPVKGEFSKSCRKDIRRAIRNGVTYQITEAPKEIDAFKTIYYQTMERNDASTYYFFNDEYFSNCLKYFRKHILVVQAFFEETTVAMGFYFIYNKTIHMHLSGTLDKYLALSPAYVLKYGVTQWGKENGYNLIHHGGGKSEAIDDSLYLFKKKFGANTEFDFYIGKKIWNQDVYTKLCAEKGIDQQSDFFPAYRKK